MPKRAHAHSIKSHVVPKSAVACERVKGEEETNENVIIDMHIGTQLKKPKFTTLSFSNVTFVNITTITMRCPSIYLEGGFLTLTDLKLYGYKGIVDILSSINVTGVHSKALIDNCTFQQNCFIQDDLGAKITLNNSTFQSYRHEFGSIVVAFSSIITLTGNVNFSDSVTGIHRPEYSSGTAVFLRTTHPDQNSLLHIATVYFVNLSCSNFGAAV